MPNRFGDLCLLRSFDAEHCFELRVLQNFLSFFQVYPTSARSTGVGIATAIGKIGGIVCPIIAVGMLRSCHQMEAVVVFELVLGLAGVACILFPVETKGREMK